MPWALVGHPLGPPLGRGPSPGLSSGSWWGAAGALGSPGALRGSGPAGALGSSGALPWALPWALGPPLGPPLDPGGALRGPWALREPCGDWALPGPLKILKT